MHHTNEIEFRTTGRGIGSDPSAGQFNAMIKQAEADKQAEHDEIQHEFAACCYSVDERAALANPEVRAAIHQAFSERRAIWTSGGTLGDFVRSSLTSGPFARLPADLEAALAKLSARHPAPENALLI